jgi:hypothetical protein
MPLVQGQIDTAYNLIVKLEEGGRRRGLGGDHVRKIHPLFKEKK